jgi:hypothetical protein
MESLVCGFGALESGLGGLAWNLEGGGGVLLTDGTTSAGTATIAANGRDARIQISDGERAVDAGLVARGDSVVGVGGAGAAEAAACMASVQLEGSGPAVPCPGHATKWSSDPLEGAGVFRHLAIETAEGALLIVTARAEPGEKGHSAEEASAWLIDNTGALREFEETLISTQYDGAGRPTRFGLELWPEDGAPPTRVTASLLGGAEAGSCWAGLFRSHTDGAEGLGAYLLWRA